MATESRNIIHVFDGSEQQADPLLMGVLYVSEVRGKEIFSFEYDANYLKSGDAFEIDPDLRLFEGPQYLPEDRPNFGIFLDSSPDRWGRVLLERKEAARARAEVRSPDTLMESDYLLGVFDLSRMGAFRFKTDPEGPFLDDDPEYSTPPFARLRELEYATRALEDESGSGDEDYLKSLALLIAPGSSLGGARPKANVADSSGNLWIAKFPSSRDDVDQGAWEFVTCQLAGGCGIEMAESRAELFYSDHHTFLTKRFDRRGDNSRLHFFSAMTLLGYQDGTDASSGVSYLDFIELLMQRGAEVEKDLEQLWRRIIFNICVSNTDDHLRNHGFFLTDRGLRLSPAYDMNPDPDGYGLSLNIDEYSNDLNLDLALEVAPYFRLAEPQAENIISEVLDSVSRWESVAGKLEISRKEKERMAGAFRTE